MQIKSIDDLQKAKGAGLAQLYPDKPKILVGMATCGLAAGAQRVYDLLQKKAQQEHWDGVVEKTGCIGFCYKEPLVDAILPGKPRVTYEKVTPEAGREPLGGTGGGPPPGKAGHGPAGRG